MDYAAFFANRLASLRLQKGVSARDMSLSLGQSESYINKIENRYAFPSMTGFFNICEYFDITPLAFFDGVQADPAQLSGLDAELRKLSAEQLQHIKWIVSDILED